MSSLGNHSNPGIEPASPDWQVDTLPLSHLESPLSHSEMLNVVTWLRQCPHPQLIVTNFKE